MQVSARQNELMKNCNIYVKDLNAMMRLTEVKSIIAPISGCFTLGVNKVVYSCFD